MFVALAESLHDFPGRTVRDIAFDVASNYATMCFNFDVRVESQAAIRCAISPGPVAFHAAVVDIDDSSWDLALRSVARRNHG